MISNPTIEQQNNLDKYWEVVRQVEPEFALIRTLLDETGVNPHILPKVIRAISNISMGAGYGRVIIYLRNKNITKIESQEDDQLSQPSVIKEQMRVIVKEKFMR